MVIAGCWGLAREDEQHEASLLPPPPCPLPALKIWEEKQSEQGQNGQKRPEKGYREGPKILGLEGRKDPGTGKEAAEEEGFRGSPPALHGWGMAAAAGITPSSCAPARGFASPEGNVAEVWIHLTVRGEKQPACWDVGEKFLKA